MTTLAQCLPFLLQKRTLVLNLKGLLHCERKTAEKSERLTSRRSAKLDNLVQYSIHKDVAQALCGSLTP